ncbi:DUF5076 domain-containing protein [Brevundimonas nasdae]|uniref:DUF5076 domain-containing protein n=1 Tax=Brevundimonas nasdae TaxID=172043 RepID=A0ACD4VHN8_9CAUL|nr:DUF5076 domain-containing protein [Brevundimonas nasdae]WOB77478.1 DUF5076 domain-containing protein [Brevundimonas nasdae]
MSTNDLTIDTQSLPVPEQVLSQPLDRVVELARVWWSGDQPEMIIRPAAQDPKLMGMVLADLAWHFSNAYAAGPGLDQKDSLDRILEGWKDGHKFREDAKPGGNA